MVGPLALFAKTAVGWDIKCADDITPESLSAFLLLEPKLGTSVVHISY